MPTEPDALWQRLVEEARLNPDPKPEVPYGFATRVVARWKSSAEPTLLEAMSSLSQRFFMIGVGAFALCAVFCFWPVDTTSSWEGDWSPSALAPEEIL